MAARLGTLLPASIQGALPNIAVPDVSGARPFAVPVRIRMPFVHERLRAAGIVALFVVAVLLGTGLTSSSAGDLQSQIAAGKSAASSLRAQIAADSALIGQTTHGLADANQRLATLQETLTAREDQLRTVQGQLLQARNHLVDLENQLERATKALAANLVAGYEQAPPNLVTVILEAHGFTQLIERVNFMHRIAEQNAQTVAWTRATRAAVARQARLLETLEGRDQKLTAQVLAQRNSVAALQAALFRQQISELASRGRESSKLHALNGRLASLEAKAAAEAAPGRRHRQRERRRDRGQHRRDGAGASRRAGRGGAGDRRRQRDRHAPVHLRRWSRVVPRRRLRLLGLGELRARRRRPRQLADGLGRVRGLGRPRPGPLDHDLRERRPRLDGGRRVAVRHGRAGRGRDALVARWRRVLGFVVRHPPGL